LALSDAPNGRRISKARSVKNPHAHWSDRQKIEAVTTYLMLGSIPLVAATLKIPEETLWRWKRTDWWHETITEVKSEESLVLSTKIKKIVDKSWEVVADRMENGDFVYNQKTGELIRKPVSMRDASKVAIDSSNLREKLNMTGNFTVANEQIEEKLGKLAKAFQDLAKGIVRTQDVETIEYTEVDDAVHDQWEEGLQTGESPVQLETRTEEGPQ
jgi:Glu-tRNA(Gln) amidotransferase subunit E-like FAD-binding protein